MNTDAPSSITPPPLPGAAPAEPPAPIANLGGLIEAILRQPDRLVQLRGDDSRGLILGGLLIIVLCGALIYGLVMGTFAGGVQIWATPIKLTLGLLVSGLICLPSLYILSCMEGSPAGLRDVARVLAGLSALSTVLLLGFAPVAWVFSQSTQSVVAMGMVHLGFWLIATLFGLRFLGATFRRWNTAGHFALKLWMIVYLLVCLQMSAALRPLIGTSTTFLPMEKKFFVSHWIDSFQEKPANTPVQPSR